MKRTISQIIGNPLYLVGKIIIEFSYFLAVVWLGGNYIQAHDNRFGLFIALLIPSSAFLLVYLIWYLEQKIIEDDSKEK